MADYPQNIPTYREIENRPQITFDPNKKNVLFVEDIQKVRQELTATQEVIGTADPAPQNPILTMLDNMAQQIDQLQTHQAELESEVENLTPRIGRIFITMEDVNPGTYLPGTWEKVGEGRTLVAVDESDSDLDEPGKEYGTKTNNLRHTHDIPDHNHFIDEHQHGLQDEAVALIIAATGSNSVRGQLKSTNSWQAERWRDDGNSNSGAGPSSSSGAPLQGNTDVGGDSFTHDRDLNAEQSLDTQTNNMQPSLTTYFWQRIS